MAMIFARAQAQTPVQPIDSLQASYTLSELVSRLEQQKTQIAATAIELQDTVAVSQLKTSIASLTKSVKEKIAESQFFLNTYSREWLAQNLMAKWRREKARIEDIAEDLTEETKLIESLLARNKEWRDQWLATRKLALENPLIANIRSPIVELLSSLRSEERALNQRIKIYLGLQKTLSANRKIVTDHIDRFTPLIEPDFFTFMSRDDSVLWKQEAVRDSLNLKKQLTRTVAFVSGDLVEYYDLYSRRFFWILAIGVGIYVMLRMRTNRLPEGSDQFLPDYKRRPFIHAYTITLLVGLPILINRPPLLTQLWFLLFTPPLFILVVGPTRGMLRVATFLLVVVYWFYQLTDVLIVSKALSRYFDLSYAILGTIFLFILSKNRTEFKSELPQLYQFTKGSFIPYLLFFTSLAVVLQLLGFTLLARTLTRGSISFAYLAPVILISSSIVRDMLQFLEQTALVKESALAQRYYSSLYTLVKGLVIYLLLFTLVSAFSLKPAVYELINQVWNFGGTFGDFTISVGDILEFFFIVFVSWIVSVVTQVVLEGEILARFDLRRGVAMAVGILARYTLMILGFLAAIASTGFDINKISILAGALGVGIGFGLQNLVANFISGLIIIFERPFVVGDTIRSSEVEGSVQQIGIRASRIQTYDSAEVIIPNSELISNRVINFTLSNKERRFLIIVRTAIHADPAEVIRILLGIARNQETVLTSPAPVVSFEGQSEQTLVFNFYYWIVGEYFRTRTELNVAIVRELKSIGVELPLHVVELRGGGESVPSPRE